MKRVVTDYNRELALCIDMYNYHCTRRIQFVLAQCVVHCVLSLTQV